MRIIRESQLARDLSADVNIFLRPILKEAFRVRVLGIDIIYILRGEIEKRYSEAEERKRGAEQEWFWRSVAIANGYRP
jgi:hypothetical protein